MSDTRPKKNLSPLTQRLVVCVLATCASPFTLAQRTGLMSDQVFGGPATSSSLDTFDRVPQNPPQQVSQPAVCSPKHLGQCLKDIAHDQAGIWTSPLRLKSRDAIWLIPFAAGTGIALHYDAEAQQELGVDKTRIDASSTFSDVGHYGSIAGTAGMYLLGAATHNDRLAETGRLGEEAIVNSLIVAEALKLATNRERPNEGNGQGGFWPHGTRSYETDGSFPSAHAAASFALARVIAYEYPSKPIQVAAYAFALAISTSRVTAREHFPSDVFVGGTFGYLIGGYVVHHHATGDGASSVFISPLMNQSTRAYGLHVELTPGKINLGKMGRFFGRLQAPK